jgi:rhodanese-related sulfurtransferase
MLEFKMSLPILPPKEAHRLISEGAALIDIREADEFARERIPCATNTPLSKLDSTDLKTGDAVIVFHCRSGARTQANAERLAKSVGGKAYLVEGGMDAWKRAGLPTERKAGAPIELMRQVMIAAGLLVLAGVILGTGVDPRFYALSAFVGAGLTFSGVTGICAMANILRRMPWNRQIRTA